MKQLGIDLGSTFVKYAVFDLERDCIICQEKIPSIPRLSNLDGKYEVSAKAIIEQIEVIIIKMMNRYEDLDGVIFSTQMHGFVFKADGANDPVYVSWQDLRSLNPISESEGTWLNYLKQKFPESLMKQTGVHIKTALALCNLYVLTREEGAKPIGEFFTLGSYIVQRLTGNNCCHITNAAPSGMVDISTGSWCQEVITEAGFENIRFPKILCGFESCGKFNYQERTLNVYADYGDQQSTILGCGPILNDLIINIGTASQICQVVDLIVPNGYEVRPFFDGTFLNTVTNLPGGRNFETYLDFIEDAVKTFSGRDISHAELWQVLDRCDSWQSRGLVMKNRYFNIADGSAEFGSISGITPSNFRSTSLTAAAYEDIANEYFRYYQMLTKETEKPSRVLLAGGKLSKQNMMVKTISRYFDIPVVTSPKVDTVFDGLYRILQVCCGKKKSLDETNNLRSI